MIIKQLALEQRPRERLISNGVSGLSDAEILALILEKGSVGESVIDLAHRLINCYGLNSLNSLSLKELTSLKGIGKATSKGYSGRMRKATC